MQDTAHGRAVHRAVQVQDTAQGVEQFIQQYRYRHCPGVEQFIQEDRCRTLPRG
jgi:hypothetical protein